MSRLRVGKFSATGGEPTGNSEMTPPPPASHDSFAQFAVFGGIDDVDTTAHYGDRAAEGVERALMGLGVDSTRETADDGEALGGQFEAEPLRHPATGVAGGARSDHCDMLGIGAVQLAAQEEIGGRVRYLAEVDGIVRVGPAHEARADPRQFAEFLLDRIEVGETRNIVRGGTLDTSLGEIAFSGGEDSLGRLEMLK
jgi:hypothetical protein